jgi:hypothetical protein
VLGAGLLLSPLAAWLGVWRLRRHHSGTRVLLGVSALASVACAAVGWRISGVGATVMLQLCSATGLAAGAVAATRSQGRRRVVEQVATARGWRQQIVWVLGVGLTVSFGSIALWATSRAGVGTASEAANKTVTAIAAGDALAIAEILDPAERDALLSSGQNLLGELRRLKVVDHSPINSRRPPQTTSAPRITLEVLRSDLVVANLSAPLRMPNTLTSVIGERTADRAAEFNRLVMVKASGRWHFSVASTLAEHQRIQTNRSLTSDAPTPNGAVNPEAAVRNLLQAISELDDEAVIAALDPQEGATLYRYSALYTDQFDRWAAWSQDNAQLSFPDIRLTTDQTGSVAHVQVTKLSAQLVLPSELGVGSRVLLDGNCIDATVERESSRHCGREIPQVIADLFGVKAPDLGSLSWLDQPEQQLSIVVVQRDGEWFVAPLRTILDTIELRLASMSPSDFDGTGNSASERVDQWINDPLRALAR